MLDPKCYPQFLPPLSLPICVTLQYWRVLLSRNDLRSSYSQLSIPLGFAPLHVPDLCIASWKDKGITTMEDLYDGSQLKSFRDLQTCYGLPQADYYKYT